MILKIILLILLALLFVIAVICFLNIKITVHNRNGLAYKITADGIPTKAKYLLGIDLDGDDGKKEKSPQKTEQDKPGRKSKKDKSEKSAKKSKQAENSEPGLATSTVLSLLVNIAKTGIQQLPRCLRIKLKYLDIKIGGTDAAQTALNYGKIYGAVSGALAFLGDYKGVFHGFRAKRKNICITADFLSEETSAEFELSVSFFLWQLLYYNIKLEVSAIMAIMDDDTELTAQATDKTVPDTQPLKKTDSGKDSSK